MLYTYHKMNATPLVILSQQFIGCKWRQGKWFEANLNLHPYGTNGDVARNTFLLDLATLWSHAPMGTENMMVEYTLTDVLGDFY
jgi:hypothetical protein